MDIRAKYWWLGFVWGASFGTIFGLWLAVWAHVGA